MKKILVWSLCLLLLSGCAQPQPQNPTHTARTAAPTVPPRTAFGSFPLEQSQVTELYSLGDALLLFSPGILARIDCETLATTASAEVASSVSAVQVSGNRVSCYDPLCRELTVLDGQLRERLRLGLPQDITGTPCLSEDGSSLFYCTDSAIRVLDIGSGVSRVLKETPSAEKTLEGLLLADSVVHYSYHDPILGRRSLFLRSDTGMTLLEREQTDIRSHAETYCARLSEETVFGWAEEPPQVLLPIDPDALSTPLPEANLVVTTAVFPEKEEVTLRCYDLSRGQLSGELTLRSLYSPRCFCRAGDAIWFLLWDGEKDTLCRWDPSLTPSEDPGCYAAAYHSAEAPDTEGLEACLKESQRIGNRFGIRLLIWTDAGAAAPEGYSLKPEHRTYILNRTLRLLEERLIRYPSGFLEQLGQLNICLVRSIVPDPSNPSSESPEGLHFRNENGSFLILASTREQVLWYHLCHLIESRVLTHSHAYDDWDSLNPGDFEYDYDYEKNRTRDGSAFLQETSRSFVDTFSMSFPSEDRARIMENAMTPGNAALFSAPILQQKLSKLCTGIREAFGLTDYAAPLPWEQYLLRPLAPASRE